MKNASQILITLLLAGNLFAQQPGDLDSTFGVNGMVTTDFDSEYEYISSVALDSNGRIIAVGISNTGNNWDFAVARYNTDGTLDSSFGVNGRMTTFIGTDADHAESVAIQPDGKMVVAGWSDNTFNSDFALVRYNVHGTLDITFDTDGKVATQIGAGDDVANSVVIQRNGKIVVAGYSLNNDLDFALARYNADGSLDNSFGTGGKVTTDFGIGPDWASSVVLQPDGKIVAFGSASSGPNWDFALARYNRDGTLDNSFATAGKLTTAIGTDNDYGYGVALQPDGKIIVAGSSLTGNYNRFSLARYNANGTPDTTFGINGILTSRLSAGEDDARSVVLQSDGKIIAAGRADKDFGLIRYLPNGSPDGSFSVEGKVVTDFGSDFDKASCVIIQPDGKIVAGGYSYNETDFDFALARYLSGLNVGILSFSPAENVLLYPNPIHSNEVLEYTLQQDEVLSIGLYDISGKLVKQLISSKSRSKGSHKETLNFGEDLSAGNYLLTITNGKGSESIKIIKQ